MALIPPLNAFSCSSAAGHYCWYLLSGDIYTKGGGVVLSTVYIYIVHTRIFFFFFFFFFFSLKYADGAYYLEFLARIIF